MHVWTRHWIMKHLNNNFIPRHLFLTLFELRVWGPPVDHEDQCRLWQCQLFDPTSRCHWQFRSPILGYIYPGWCIILLRFWRCGSFCRVRMDILCSTVLYREHKLFAFPTRRALNGHFWHDIYLMMVICLLNLYFLTSMPQILCYQYIDKYVMPATFLNFRFSCMCASLLYNNCLLEYTLWLQFTSSFTKKGTIIYFNVEHP
jgi:hypothetical protein